MVENPSLAREVAELYDHIDTSDVEAPDGVQALAVSLWLVEYKIGDRLYGREALGFDDPEARAH